MLSLGPFSAMQYMKGLEMAGLLPDDDIGETCKPISVQQDELFSKSRPFPFLHEDYELRKTKTESAWAALQRLKGEEGFS